MRDRILLWNDDNHEPSVWINQHFMGVDFITVIESALNEKPNSENNSEILEIYPWDFKESDDDNYNLKPKTKSINVVMKITNISKKTPIIDIDELEEGEADILFDWFQDCPNITDKQ
ncbi:MAG: hypothetical protein ACLTPN_01025 [Clostridia bacterium]